MVGRRHHRRARGIHQVVGLYASMMAVVTTQLMASNLEHVALNNATAQRRAPSRLSSPSLAMHQRSRSESNVESELGVRRRSRGAHHPRLGQVGAARRYRLQHHRNQLARPRPKQTRDESETTETIGRRAATISDHFRTIIAPSKQCTKLVSFCALGLAETLSCAIEVRRYCCTPLFKTRTIQDHHTIP
ncbi:hypothetical protein BKA62DRAFT_115048 [Auriculariales sp. MPI-PUGE-AT-0066]|nr:hypothetical protein BKA62DRAFT_115048 [Auriculariales sp. MPI-PUGE-AT-0066]